MLAKPLAILLAFILLVAGILHGLKPQLFMVAMPSYLPAHYELVILTGLIEIVLAAGLIKNSTRKLTGLFCALYFLAILPAHIHVSLNGIPMFGVRNPALLWTRTAFQTVFIAWGLYLFRAPASEEKVTV